MVEWASVRGRKLGTNRSKALRSDVLVIAPGGVLHSCRISRDQATVHDLEVRSRCLKKTTRDQSNFQKVARESHSLKTKSMCRNKNEMIEDKKNETTWKNLEKFCQLKSAFLGLVP